MDLQSGFHQQNLEEESRRYTAFTVPTMGQFQFKVSCFGSHGAPSSFSALMDTIFCGIPRVITYIDDILCFSQTHEQHIQDLNRIFTLLARENLKLNPHKCLFGSHEVEYLGFNISGKGISITQSKIDALSHQQPPDSIKKIRQFLGLANFFRSHIKDFAKISTPLSELTRKDNPYSRGPLPEKAREAFETLLQALITAPVLALPDINLPYELYTDAATGSDDSPPGFGAVLCQRKNNKLQVIGYASKTPTKAEKNYSATMMEQAAIVFGLEHFHNYLYGQKTFKIFTDNKPITAAADKIKNKTLQRLQDKTIPYNFSLHYMKGSNMGAPDYLSRNVVNNTLSRTISTIEHGEVSLDADEIQKAQTQDPYWNNIINHLNDHSQNHKYSGKFTIFNNLLMYNNQDKNVIVIPKSLHNKILEMYHDNPTIGGHRGYLPTLMKIRQFFFLEKDSKLVSEFVRSCKECQFNKQGPKTKNKLCPLEVPNKFNYRVHSDLIVMTTSSRGYNYIMNIIDAYTKYAVLVPLRTKRATEVAEAFLDKWICYFGPPNILVTDNGTEYTNTLVNQINKLLKVHHVHTTPYHPQSNGISERLNQTLYPYIKTLIRGNKNDWAATLSLTQLAYNTAWQRSTKSSPYYATFYNNPNSPFDNIIDFANKQIGIDHPTQVLRMLHAARLHHGHVTDAQRMMRDYYDKKTTKKLFEIGDLVLRHKESHERSSVSPKLESKWSGPYMVISTQKDLNTCTIQLHPTTKPIKINTCKLKHFYARSEDNTPQNTSNRDKTATFQGDREEEVSDAYPHHNTEKTTTSETNEEPQLTASDSSPKKYQ
eukprot:TRINITY_DN256_c2_g1_i4.p1 TRINITY_DN256_c2_g1~~TRINITY_DN256_c2_g1_i4.p1  ORF type:complete len:962 (+),score=47.55 TRINITY_DN256_c2_g1_i4:417-2888(+)